MTQPSTLFPPAAGDITPGYHRLTGEVIATDYIDLGRTRYLVTLHAQAVSQLPGRVRRIQVGSRRIHAEFRQYVPRNRIRCGVILRVEGIFHLDGDGTPRVIDPIWKIMEESCTTPQ